jgi:hypothetical protein
VKKALAIVLAVVPLLGPASAVAQGAAPQVRRGSPPQPIQKQGLDYFEGTWRFTWTGREGPTSPGPRSGTLTFTRAAIGSALDVAVAGTVEGGAAYRERGTLAWDAEKKTLMWREQLSGGVELAGAGDWSSPISIRYESQPVRIAAQSVRIRRTYGIVSATSFTIAEEVSTDGGAWVRLGGGVFSKQP